MPTIENTPDHLAACLICFIECEYETKYGGFPHSEFIDGSGGSESFLDGDGSGGYPRGDTGSYGEDLGEHSYGCPSSWILL